MSTATTGRAREYRVRDQLAARFFNTLAEEGECWVWQGPLNDAGYGIFIIRKKRHRAHRWCYEFLREDIPAGLVIDHLCRNRACVNPWHLEPVTGKVNAERGVSWNGSKTHCKRGHEFVGDNIGRQNGGYRYCRTCKRAGDAKRWSA